MRIFNILTTLDTRDGRKVYHNFEHPAETVDELTAILARDGIVSGHRIDLTPYGMDGKRRVTGREPLGIGRGIVATIKIYQHDVIDGRTEK